MFNVPLNEIGIIGLGTGLATQGSTAVPEIQFAGYMHPAFDQVCMVAFQLIVATGLMDKIGFSLSICREVRPMCSRTALCILWSFIVTCTLYDYCGICIGTLIEW